jgi:putative SOS response-associated peptidase YedK
VNDKLLHCHDLIAKDGAILLGGLCREWVNKDTGETAVSCSVITLPPHPKLMHIHRKASLLLLTLDMELVNHWLDESITHPSEFEPLLQPHIPYDLIAMQMDKPSTFMQ